jgi:hypothetical protein
LWAGPLRLVDDEFWPMRSFSERNEFS